MHARGRAALAVDGVSRHIFANELERVSEAVLYKAPWLSSQLEKTNRSKKQNMPNGQHDQLGLLRMAQNRSIAGLEGRLTLRQSILF